MMEWLLIKLAGDEHGLLRLKPCPCGQVLFQAHLPKLTVMGAMRGKVAEVQEGCACGRLIEADYFTQLARLKKCA